MIFLKYIKYFCFLSLSVFLITSGCSSKNSSKTLSDNVIHIKSNNKPVMLIFDLSNCVYCKKITHDLNNNTEIKKLSGEMSVYHINAAEIQYYTIPHKGENLKTDTRTLEHIYGFRGSTPYVVITDKRFNTILKVPGYLKPSTFTKVLTFILTKAYKKTDIKDFLYNH